MDKPTELAPAPACRIGMSCSMPALVTYLLRGALIQNGLSEDDAKRVAMETSADEAHPALFNVRVLTRDGTTREVLRIEDEAHLNSVINRATTCGYLVADVKRILEA